MFIYTDRDAEGWFRWTWQVCGPISVVDIGKKNHSPFEAILLSTIRIELKNIDTPNCIIFVYYFIFIELKRERYGKGRTNEFNAKRFQWPTYHETRNATWHYASRNGIPVWK